IRETLPWVEYVVTKKSRNGNVIELLPVEQVRAELREKARVAMSEWKRMKAVSLTTPIRGGLRAYSPATLEPLRGGPGVGFDGPMVTFTAPDFRAASDAIWALLGVAIRLGQSTELPSPSPGKKRYHGAM